MTKKDINALKQIVKYCNKIEEIKLRFGNSKEIFCQDEAYQLSRFLNE